MTAVSHPEEGRPVPAGARLADPAGPAAVPAHSHRDWLSSPALQGAAALLIYLVVWLLTSARMLVLHASWAQLDQKSQDPNFYVWSLRWWPYAIGHALNPLYSHQIAAPAGHSLAWVTTVPPLALLATPLTLLAGPVTVLQPPRGDRAAGLGLGRVPAVPAADREVLAFPGRRRGLRLFRLRDEPRRGRPAQPDLQPADADPGLPRRDLVARMHQLPRVRDPGRPGHGRAVLPVPGDLRRHDRPAGGLTRARLRPGRAGGPAGDCAPGQARRPGLCGRYRAGLCRTWRTRSRPSRPS